MLNLFHGGNFKTPSECIMVIINIHNYKSYLYCGRMSGHKRGNNNKKIKTTKTMMSKEEGCESKLSFATERVYMLRTSSFEETLHFMKTVGKVTWNQDPYLGKVPTYKNASRFQRRKPELWFDTFQQNYHTSILRLYLLLRSLILIL